MDITARGLLMLSPATAAMAMDMVAIMATTARSLLMPRLRPGLSLAMATMAGRVTEAMVATDMAMAMATTAIARGFFGVTDK